jgi:hypothetical protein
MIPIRKIFQNFFITLVRYPAPILSAILSFIFFLIVNHFLDAESVYARNFVFVRWGLECMSGISLFIAFDVFSELRKVGFAKRLGFILLGFCVLGLHYYSITPGMFESDGIFFSRYLIFLVCFHLMVSFIAFYESKEILSFWQYNYFLFRQFIVAFTYSITLFAGIASALWAIAKLFGFYFSDKYYTDIGVFVFLVFNTMYFLMNMPTQIDEFKLRHGFRPSVRIFVQYILLPIVALYAGILYVYMAKIIWTQYLPIGWVCVPILIFSILGILSFLLIYPIRHDKQYKLIFIFSKYYFYLVLPLLSLYFISIIQRVSTYGITEDRYLVIILGLWIAIISFYFIISKLDNITIIPISLFLLLSLSAIGPWGMFQLSVQNQLHHLEVLLKKNKLLNDDKLITVNSKTKLSSGHIESIQSILDYLNKRGEIEQIKYWLRDSDQQLLDKAVAANEPYSVYAMLGNSQISSYKIEPNVIYVNTNNSNSSSIPIAINNYKYFRKIDPYQIQDKEQIRQEDSVKGYLNKNTFYLVQDGIQCQISLDTIIQVVLNYRKDLLNKDSTKQNLSPSVIQNGISQLRIPHDSLDFIFKDKKLNIESLQIEKMNDKYQIQFMNAYLLY